MLTSKIAYSDNHDDPATAACAPCVAEAVLPEIRSSESETLADSLSQKYPRTVAALRQIEGGLQHLTYITAIEERWKKIARGEMPQEGEVLHYVPSEADLPPSTEQYDLVYCGGVLGLFSAAVMARKGFRVLVFDQRRVGTSHREWNISDEELEKFVEAGLFTREELEQAVSSRYKRGVIRFYNKDIGVKPAELWLDRVLEVAIDLGTLLEMARRKFEEAGGVIRDFRSFKKVYVTEQGKVRSVVEVQNQAGELEYYKARLTVNALGSISPLSLVLQNGKPFQGICPTVGSTAINFKTGKGEKEVDPEIGDVLLTVAHAQSGRQLIWEGFPGRNGEMTVYVFYYDTVSPDKAAAQSLLDLFERYFELLSTYKEPGEGFAHIKPVYGFIPARHFQHKVESASKRGIISVGDATSPQSALTFCGFGSQVRNLPRLTRLLERALQEELLEEKDLRRIGAHQTNISELWVFSRFMQPYKADERPEDVNRIMNVFCDNLNRLGPALTRRFFQDKVLWSDYNRITFGTAIRYPKVYPLTFENIGMQGVWYWVVDYIRLSREAILCGLYRKVGQKRQAKLLNWLENRNKSLALALSARHEEWQASGWL
ncbi:MAG: hypothetical protein HXX08_04265 [Chloroflexi bacterium]|uniref:FAD-dependent oxidoreductase n=1 Tax=Candidatus Chlorohelix allophototropha TaxID=3003348 RepID=A0A8T7M2Y6_9CHLR|nr:hypothetical protein [Chloroflexota bacterium]WJW66955.1 hypothetical protein OZ401_000201 [Chloroflexota bacterium L227-S17]